MTLEVSSSCCLSLVVRKGSEEATKSMRREGSSILAAMVRSSSERVGDSATICWNWETTLRISASKPEVSAGGSISSSGSISATMKGSVWVKRTSRTRLYAFSEHEAALVGHPDNLVNGGQGADFVQVVGLGGVEAGIDLGGDHDGALLAQGFDELDGAFTADREWQNRMGEQDRIADG